MRSISKELLAKLTKDTDNTTAPAATGPRLDHAAIMAESRRSGVPDDELRRVYEDEFYERQEWERKEEALRAAIEREARTNARYFGGDVEALRKALLRCFLESGEVKFSSRIRELKFYEIVKRIDKV